jgi:hypothetical protein
MKSRIKSQVLCEPENREIEEPNIAIKTDESPTQDSKKDPEILNGNEKDTQIKILPSAQKFNLS